LILGNALRGQLEVETKAGPRAEQKLRGAVASSLHVHVRKDGDLGTLDDRVTADLTTETPLRYDEVLRALDALKASGDYDRIVREARGEG
jgi:hypothetical protein